MDNLSTVQQQQQMTANQPPRPPVVPYDLMFPFLIPHLHPDKAAELQFLFAKYKTHELAASTFFILMKRIVPKEMMLSAAAKVEKQLLASKSVAHHDPSLVQQQMTNLQLTVNEQPNTQINSIKPVPYDLMLPFLIPHIEADKAVELQTLLDKYKRDEIPRHTVLRRMLDIVGGQLLKSAADKVAEQKKANKGSSSGTSL